MDIGQLFITGISGLVLTETEAEIIKKNNLSGVIFFAHNYEDPAQLTELINSIKELKPDHPYFFCVDHEGGRVQRFKNNFTHFPSMFKVASKTNSPKKIFEMHSIMAKELAACGINVNLSPCADIWTNEKNTVIGDRSFGRTVDVVEKFTTSAIRGLQTQGILACPKHFPGHGMTTKDSHIDLPIVKKTIEELNTHEILPFKKAVRSKVHFMMMAHLLMEAIDKELPTSLSKKAYDYLRESTDFKGIIISDDMEMKAIADRYSYGDAAKIALTAGCDILEYRSMETMIQGFEGVKNAFEKGELNNQIYQDKIERITYVKNNFLLPHNLIDITEISNKYNKLEHENFLKNLMLELGE